MIDIHWHLVSVPRPSEEHLPILKACLEEVNSFLETCLKTEVEVRFSKPNVPREGGYRVYEVLRCTKSDSRKRPIVQWVEVFYYEEEDSA